MGNEKKNREMLNVKKKSIEQKEIKLYIN